MPDTLADFNEFRSKMNDVILGAGNLTINRFFALDTRAYEAGALGVETKEMLGLVASVVLRCDDCITYHIERCHQKGARPGGVSGGLFHRARGRREHRHPPFAKGYGSAGGVRRALEEWSNTRSSASFSPQAGWLEHARPTRKPATGLSDQEDWAPCT